MCGICGELRFDGVSPALSVIEAMKQQLVKRGPDAEGSYLNENIALGHRRLSIIDLSDRAAQPMADREAGVTLVFNGTIYNYPELREELQALGHRFKSTGDTEVILRAYIQWGESCVVRLQGMFAFAIWDKNRQQLLLARDRCGIKPLYYSKTPQRLLFASNTRAIIHADKNVDKSIDATAMHHLFTLHAVVPAPRTILKGISKVKPAHYLLINGKGEVTEKSYWSLKARRPDRKMTEQDWSVYDIHIEEPVSRQQLSQILDQCQNSSSFYFKPTAFHATAPGTPEPGNGTPQKASRSDGSREPKSDEVLLTLTGAFIVKEE